MGAGAPGHVPGASDRPAAERPRLMARLSQLRPLGLETIKLYVALVYGRVSDWRGEIEAHLGRSRHNRTRMAVLRGGAGRASPGGFF